MCQEKNFSGYIIIEGRQKQWSLPAGVGTGKDWDMNKQILEECEQSFYREIYPMDHPGCSVVTDETTGKLYIRKKLQLYDRRVYAYLKEHRHRNIPKIYEVWETDGTLTVIEELIQGDRLSTLLENGGLSDEQKYQVLIQICDALLFLHAAVPPIIHRDVKAENIMVTEEKRAVLIDYDAAKIYHENKSRDTVLLGTEGSAAPEQYGFGQSDVRTDVYGTGALIRKMFPFDSGMQQISERAMRMDPDQRYQTIGELKSELEDWFFRRQDETAEDSPTQSRTGNPEETFRIQSRRLIQHTVNIPGFRTGRPWKMIVASLGYLFIICVGLEIDADPSDSVANLWLNRIFFMAACLSLVDLFCDWSHLFMKFPLLRDPRRMARVGGYIICASAVILFWVDSSAYSGKFSVNVCREPTKEKA